VQSGAGSEAVDLGRLVFELADDIVPLASRNFMEVRAATSSDDVVALNGLQLCTRPTGEGYRDSSLFHVRKGFGIYGGDWRDSRGIGGHSAFKRRNFADENFIGQHTGPGVLSYANSGVHSNTSVFFISLDALPHMSECNNVLCVASIPSADKLHGVADGRYVAFGHIISGMKSLTGMAALQTVSFRPVNRISIRDCGVLPANAPVVLDAR
jgi:cyclophilin family peptidyl-prolyl cis-trans isomerase